MGKQNKLNDVLTAIKAIVITWGKLWQSLKHFSNRISEACWTTYGVYRNRKELWGFLKETLNHICAYP